MATPFSGTPQQGRKRSAADVASAAIANSATQSRSPPAAADSIDTVGQNSASPRRSRNQSSLLTPEPARKPRIRRGAGTQENNAGGKGGADDEPDAAAGTVFTPGTSTAHLLLQLRSSWARAAMSPVGAAGPTAAGQSTGYSVAGVDNGREGDSGISVGSGSSGGENASGFRPSHSQARTSGPASPPASSLPPKKRPKTTGATVDNGIRASKPGRSSNIESAVGGSNRRRGGGGGGVKELPVGAVAAVTEEDGTVKVDSRASGKVRVALTAIANSKKCKGTDGAALGRGTGGGPGRAGIGQPQRRSAAGGGGVKRATADVLGTVGGNVAGAGTATAMAEGCSCKKSLCLKLYCQCFAAQLLCSESCKCENCYNSTNHEVERRTAVRELLCRSPHAFDAKICKTVQVQSPGGGATSGCPALVHTTGCGCSKSACLKRYCECFNGGIACSDKCRCKDCRNTAAATGVVRVGSATARAAATAASSKLSITVDARGPLQTIQCTAEQTAPQAVKTRRAQVSATAGGPESIANLVGRDTLCQTVGAGSASPAAEGASRGGASARSPLGELHGF